MNICRYAQIAYNKNVYVTNVRLLAFAHFAIYSIPLIIIIVQIATGWARFEEYAGDSCDLAYTNIYAEIFNTVIAFFYLSVSIS